MNKFESYGNCCRLNILVTTNRHCIVTNWFYQVITIHSDTTQICSKQLIFLGSVNNSSPASDYITWPQYQPVSSICLFLTSPNKRRFILQSKDVLKAALSSYFPCLPTQSKISMTSLFWGILVLEASPPALCSSLLAGALALLPVLWISFILRLIASRSSSVLAWIWWFRRELLRQWKWWGMDCNRYNQYHLGA